MKRLLLVGVILGSMAGCSVNEKFVYKPSAPAAGVRKLPVAVAVLPFKDGTENFTKRGSFFNPAGLTYNLAKAGVGSGITALTPELWAKAFADDLAASGAFRSATFFYSPSELVDEDFIVEGTVEKANAAGSRDRANEFAVAFRASRKTDNRRVWEKEVVREWMFPSDIFEGCGEIAAQCKGERLHAYTNRVMQGIFAEAGADLMKALTSLSGSRVGEEGLLPAASPVPGSADEELEKILRGP